MFQDDLYCTITHSQDRTLVSMGPMVTWEGVIMTRGKVRIYQGEKIQV